MAHDEHGEYEPANRCHRLHYERRLEEVAERDLDDRVLEAGGYETGERAEGDDGARGGDGGPRRAQGASG